MKKGFCKNIEELTKENTEFRKVLYTGAHSQLVLMTLKPKEDIGLETHPDNDQFFRVDAGKGKCIINETEYDIQDGFAIVVPAGAQHNIINTSETDTLNIYTLYSPAHHKDGTIHHTKEEAEKSDEEFDGELTEK